MLLRWIALSCLLASTAAQAYYYCNSSSVDATRDSNVILYTRNRTQSYYVEGQICEFNVIGPVNSTFLVTVSAFMVNTAVCTISSGGRIMFSGSSMPVYKYTMVSATNSLQLRFDATGDYFASKMGVVVQVQVVNFNECPPGWVYRYNSCIGNSRFDDSLLTMNYTDAQKACNSMRSNLYILPPNFASNLSTIVNILSWEAFPITHSWMGLTDRASKLNPYWLNGIRQNFTYDIRCGSDDSYQNCYSHERCGSAYRYSSEYMIYQVRMINCSTKAAVVCSAPKGGTDIFYAVPDEVAPSSSGESKLTFDKLWMWVLIAGCLLLGVGLFIGLYYRLRASRAVAGGAAREPVASQQPAAQQPTQYPVEYPRQYPVEYPRQYPVQYPDEAAAPVNSVAAQLPPPPSYSEVMASNTGASIHYDRKLQ